ncbi:MAG: hypothetical protein KJ592_02020, partial [Nanoarchaeota archaeon]|nr:hypothetical protein [Nanoarchaeota archaeon]
NSAGGLVAEVLEEVELVFGEVYEGEILIDVADVDEGMLKISISDEEKVSFVEEDFIYSRSPGLTGFVLSIGNVEINYIVAIILVFVVIAGFLIRRIWRLRRLRRRK